MKVDVNSSLCSRIAIVAAVAGSILAASTPSFANPGSARQQMACMSDVMRLCFSSIGNDQAIISCMTRNKDNLSKRCKSTLPPI